MTHDLTNITINFSLFSALQDWETVRTDLVIITDDLIFNDDKHNWLGWREQTSPSWCGEREGKMFNFSSFLISANFMWCERMWPKLQIKSWNKTFSECTTYRLHKREFIYCGNWHKLNYRTSTFLTTWKIHFRKIVGRKNVSDNIKYFEHLYFGAGETRDVRIQFV